MHFCGFSFITIFFFRSTWDVMFVFPWTFIACIKIMSFSFRNENDATMCWCLHCLFVYLFVCLFVCLLACLFVFHVCSLLALHGCLLSYMVSIKNSKYYAVHSGRDISCWLLDRESEATRPEWTWTGMLYEYGWCEGAWEVAWWRKVRDTVS